MEGNRLDSINRSIEVITLVKEIITLSKQLMNKSFENSGLTGPQGMTLGILGRYGKMKISELGDKLGLTDSTVSGIIDRLEKQEFVLRERSTDDKRVVYVHICPKFEEIHKGFHQNLENGIQEFLNKGTSEEIEQVITGFKALKKLLST
jgi:MarR family transcriptional regulator, organic hydroperoxide resistance regulator